MNQAQRELIRRNQRVTALYAVLVVLLSVLLFIGLLRIRGPLGEDWFALLSSLIFALAGAAITILGFSWATNRDVVDTTISVLDIALHQAMLPLREYSTKNSRRSDRYDCVISQPRALIEAGYAEYFVQNIRRSFVVDSITGDLRVIFAVENRDKILSDYFDDERYIVTYKIESRDCELDVSNDVVCALHSISINGAPLVVPKPRLRRVKGANAKEYVLSIPTKELHSPYSVSFMFHVLKWHAHSTRVYIPSQVLRLTGDVEYRLTVDSSISANQIVVDTTEVSPITPFAADITSDVSIEGPGKAKFARIIIRSPIQPGSAIRFEVHRDSDAPPNLLRPQKRPLRAAKPDA